MEYIVPGSIFLSTFVIVCVVYDYILRTRMRKRLLEMQNFINSMDNMEIPERIPF